MTITEPTQDEIDRAIQFLPYAAINLEGVSGPRPPLHQIVLLSRALKVTLDDAATHEPESTEAATQFGKAAGLVAAGMIVMQGASMDDVWNYLNVLAGDGAE